MQYVLPVDALMFLVFFFSFFHEPIKMEFPLVGRLKYWLELNWIPLKNRTQKMSPLTPGVLFFPGDLTELLEARCVTVSQHLGHARGRFRGCAYKISTEFVGNDWRQKCFESCFADIMCDWFDFNSAPMVYRRGGDACIYLLCVRACVYVCACMCVRACVREFIIFAFSSACMFTCEKRERKQNAKTKTLHQRDTSIKTPWWPRLTGR